MTVTKTDMASITIPDEYGYVIAVLPLTFIVFFFLAEMVVYARKKFDVPVSILRVFCFVLTLIMLSSNPNFLLIFWSPVFCSYIFYNNN